MPDSNLVSIFLGAALAIMTSFATQAVADWREEKRRRRRLRRVLYAELLPCVQRLKKFVEFFKSKHGPEPALLFGLERSALLFERERSDIYLLESAGDRQLGYFFDRVSRSVEVLREMLKAAGSGGYERWARDRTYEEVEVLELLADEGAALAKSKGLEAERAEQSIETPPAEVKPVSAGRADA